MCAWFIEFSLFLAYCSGVGIIVSRVAVGRLFLVVRSLDLGGLPPFALDATLVASCLLMEIWAGVLGASLYGIWLHVQRH